MKHAVTGPLRRHEPLSRLTDYQVERHQNDPRGWKVLSTDGRNIGEVKDLIIDTARMRARYLDVELDEPGLDFHRDPHVLVPMDRAHRDGTHDRLILDGVTTARVAELVQARDQHAETFWERWWSDERTPAATPSRPAGTTSNSTVATDVVPSGVPQDELNRALQDVRPGEQVRIPVVEEEIIVERRPVTRHQ